jgi:hypothetical protein
MIGWYGFVSLGVSSQSLTHGLHRLQTVSIWSHERIGSSRLFGCHCPPTYCSTTSSKILQWHRSFIRFENRNLT